MAHLDGAIFCDGCGAEITWSPYLVDASFSTPGPQRRGEYCCKPCADGQVCNCGAPMDLGDEWRSQPPPASY
jgi:hypothetical protein